MPAHPKIFRVTLMHESVEVEYVKKSERDELLVALYEIWRRVPIGTTAYEIARDAINKAEGR